MATGLEYKLLYLSYSTPTGHPLASAVCVVGVLAGGSYAGSTRIFGCTAIRSRLELCIAHKWAQVPNPQPIPQWAMGP